MKNVQELLDRKEAHFLQLLEEIGALRRVVLLLEEDADHGLDKASSEAVLSANRYYVSDAQQPPPADPALYVLDELDRYMLDDPPAGYFSSGQAGVSGDDT